MTGDDALRHGYFSRRFVEALFALYEGTGRGAYLHRLWALLVFEVWWRKAVGAKVEVDERGILRPIDHGFTSAGYSGPNGLGSSRMMKAGPR